MKEFITAAKAQLAEGEDDGAIEVKHNGTLCRFYEPAEGQEVMMLAMAGRNMSKKQAGNFIALFIELGDDDTQRYFQDILLDRNSGFGIDGILDIWEYLVAEWSGKATPPPSDSPKPRRSTGPASTGRTRASTSSRSRSASS